MLILLSKAIMSLTVDLDTGQIHNTAGVLVVGYLEWDKHNLANRATVDTFFCTLAIELIY
jgi:hypothetical protein